MRLDDDRFERVAEGRRELLQQREEVELAVRALGRLAAARELGARGQRVAPAGVVVVVGGFRRGAAAQAAGWRRQQPAMSRQAVAAGGDPSPSAAPPSNSFDRATRWRRACGGTRSLHAASCDAGIGVMPGNLCATRVCSHHGGRAVWFISQPYAFISIGSSCTTVRRLSQKLSSTSWSPPSRCRVYVGRDISE